MIPPVAVDRESLGYTADALARRITDLATAAGHLASAVPTIAVSPKFAGVTGEAVSVWREVERLRDDLTAVLAVIAPQESERENSLVAAAGLFGLAGILTSAIPAVVDGRAFTSLRRVSESVENRAPWTMPGDAVVGVSWVERSTPTSAPMTMAERVNRIPRGDDRIRIDRFAGEFGPEFEVYIGGTDFAALSDEPWWAGTNIDLLASGASRSVTATDEALRLAGVTASTPVVFTGHSQGGAIALALARSGRYSVDAVFTVGTPVGLVGDAPHTPTFHVEHANDVVPALGGTIASTTGTTWVAQPAHGEWGVSAHLWSTYRDTAARIDATNDAELTAIEHRIRRHGTGVSTVARVVSSW